ncbi:MAG: hypothetical protein WC080_01895 [Patescibacteria group bacterium]
MKNELTCQTGLKAGIINDEVFNREISLCQKLSAENGDGCGWGKCRQCGVVPLLIKLHDGKLLIEDNEIKISRKNLIGQE